MHNGEGPYNGEGLISDDDEIKIFRPKTEKWHNYMEGDCGNPIKNYFKKGFWKRYDRKKFFRKMFNVKTNVEK